MGETTISTEFASASRAEKIDLDRDIHLISQTPYLCKHFDAIPSIVLILNKHRQIVFCNEFTVNALDLKERNSLYGLRVGEALKCIHAEESDHGCGTTAFCRECGAVNAMLSSLDGKTEIEECRITPKGAANPFDFQVATRPYESGNERYIVFVVNDISHEKRRKILERVFFHDISNLLAAASGCLQRMPKHPIPKGNEFAEKTYRAIIMLSNEIEAQKGLLRAEDGNLPIRPVEIHALETLENVISIFQNHDCAKGKKIAIDDHSEDIIFMIDNVQLSRIIENMLKNALEASSIGESVIAGCRLSNDKRVCYWVKNNAYIEPSEQRQIFNRSFSTKGPGRGIGTYSMKLLTERYLGGKIDFTSSPENGTEFRAVFPQGI